MKLLKQNLLLLLSIIIGNIFLISFTKCSHDKNEVQDCFLIKISEGEEFNVTNSFENNLIKTIKVVKRNRILTSKIYNYNSDGKILKSILYNGKQDTICFIEYTYNSVDLLDTIYKYTPQYDDNERVVVQTGSTIHQYDAEWNIIQLTKVNREVKEDSLMEVEFQYHFEYNDSDNIVKMIVNRIRGGEAEIMSYTEYSYDDKRNIYDCMNYFDLEPFVIPFYRSKNNVKKWIRKYPDGRTIFSESIEYFEYNSNNYPTKIIKTGPDGNTIEQKLDYKCINTKVHN